MSTLTEKAEHEAEETEAETETSEDADQQEEEAAADEEEKPAAPASMTEQEAEREFKKLEKLAETYLVKAMAIADRLGIPYQLCPLDYVPGLAVPRAEHEVTSDVEAAVLGMIGKSAPAEFKESEQYHRCAACDGWGEVLTGAQKEISRTAMCNPCGGKGFVLGPIQVPPPVAANGAYTPPVFPVGPIGPEPPKPEPYYDYGTREWKLPPQAAGV